MVNSYLVTGLKYLDNIISVQKTVLITGGAGFIGFHLGRHLASIGYRIKIIDNYRRAVNDQELSKLQSDWNVEIVDVDLNNSAETLQLGDSYNYVIHLAAIIGVSHVENQPYKVLVENVRMLENVISLCRQQKNLVRLIFTSTSEVYSGTLENHSMVVPTSEVTPLTCGPASRPRTSYMLSKIYGEVMCVQSALPFTVLRPHNIFGPRMGMAHVIPEQFQKIFNSKSGDTVSVNSPQHTRAFCYISDAVTMIEKVMLKDSCTNQILNLGSDKLEISIYELVKICIRIAGRSLDIECYEPSDGSPARRCPDMSVMFKHIGYSAQIELEEGLEVTWRWYTKNVFEKDGLTAI